MPRFPSHNVNATIFPQVCSNLFEANRCNTQTIFYFLSSTLSLLMLQTHTHTHTHIQTHYTHYTHYTITSNNQLVPHFFLSRPPLKYAIIILKVNETHSRIYRLSQFIMYFSVHKLCFQEAVVFSIYFVQYWANKQASKKKCNKMRK